MQRNVNFIFGDQDRVTKYIKYFSFWKLKMSWPKIFISIPSSGSIWVHEFIQIFIFLFLLHGLILIHPWNDSVFNTVIFVFKMYFVVEKKLCNNTCRNKTYKLWPSTSLQQRNTWFLSKTLKLIYFGNSYYNQYCS